MDDQERLFLEMMGGKVEPIAPEPKRLPAKPPPKARAIVAQSRTVAATITAPPPSSPLQSTGDPWRWHASGVSREQLRRLAAGRPAIAATFDLHGMTRDEALDLLTRGVGDALASGQRVVCLIHGRGLHSKGGRPVLREAVYRWLREGCYAAHVLAIVPQPGSGGGACLVLLRRSGANAGTKKG